MKPVFAWTAVAATLVLAGCGRSEPAAAPAAPPAAAPAPAPAQPALPSTDVPPPAAGSQTPNAAAESSAEGSSAAGNPHQVQEGAAHGATHTTEGEGGKKQ